MSKTIENLPVIDCKIYGHDKTGKISGVLVECKCPKCGQKLNHGYPIEANNDPQHRVSHCRNGCFNGYYIHVKDQSLKKYLQEHKI